jgi:hypothetical protein
VLGSNLQFLEYLNLLGLVERKVRIEEIERMHNRIENGLPFDEKENNEFEFWMKKEKIKNNLTNKKTSG